MRQSLIAHTSQSACGSGYRIALRLAIGKARNLIASCFRVPHQTNILSTSSSVTSSARRS